MTFHGVGMDFFWNHNSIVHVFINGHLHVLKKLKCLQLKKGLNDSKDYNIKMSHNVWFHDHTLILGKVIGISILAKT